MSESPSIYHYTLYVDEAGDDKSDSLKPDDPRGNSEWLCLGGYLVHAEDDDGLDHRRDKIGRAIGGRAGQPIHFRNMNPRNQGIAVGLVASLEHRARGFVICSYKKTWQGYRNARAEAVHGEQKRDTLYNYVTRLLLERVTNFVFKHGNDRGIKRPLLRIVMASRRGHYFGQFKVYVMHTLVPQAIAGTTYQDTREINPEVLNSALFYRMPSSTSAGLQLADVMVSAFFQSIEQLSPQFPAKIATNLSPLMSRAMWDHKSKTSVSARDGVTLYHPEAFTLLTEDQRQFFERFGYRSGLVHNKPRRTEHFTQAERMWSKSSPEK